MKTFSRLCMGALLAGIVPGFVTLMGAPAFSASGASIEQIPEPSTPPAPPSTPPPPKPAPTPPPPLPPPSHPPEPAPRPPTPTPNPNEPGPF